MKTREAAEHLSVSPNTLRAWERRYGFPQPARSAGRHRSYDRTEIASLRRAFEDGLSIASAIEKVRSQLGIDDDELEGALRTFDAEGADRVVEKAMGLLPVPRVVSEVLLPALEAVRSRFGDDSACWAFSAAWGAAWLERQRRITPPPTRPISLLIGDATWGPLDRQHAPVRALELLCARAGARVLTLSVLGAIGLRDATAGTTAVLLAGGGVSGERVNRWLDAVAGATGRVPLTLYRTPPERNGHALDRDPQRAQRELFVHLNGERVIPLRHQQIDGATLTALR